MNRRLAIWGAIGMAFLALLTPPLLGAEAKHQHEVQVFVHTIGREGDPIPVVQARVFIGRKITLRKKNSGESPFVVIPMKDRYWYLNGRAEGMGRTDANGLVFFRDLPPGDYVVYAVRWEDDFVEKRIRVDSTLSSPVEVEMPHLASR